MGKILVARPKRGLQIRAAAQCYAVEASRSYAQCRHLPPESLTDAGHANDLPVQSFGGTAIVKSHVQRQVARSSFEGRPQP